MNKLHTVKKPANQDWHRADIKAALEKAGWTLRRLAIHHGFSPNILIHGLAKPYPRAQDIIANALNLKPWQIWPSRYNQENQPIRQRSTFPLVRPAHWTKPTGVPKLKRNKLPEKSNVSDLEAA